MADTYANFAELKAAEGKAAWRTVTNALGTEIAIIAPHGGGIERGTSEVARGIAAGDFSLYLFEGLKEKANEVLHITSTNFDEPAGLELVATAKTVIAIHGAAGDTAAVYMGGADAALRDLIGKWLAAGGFTVAAHPGLPGADAANICNGGQSGKGVQLELTMGLRQTFFKEMSKKGRDEHTEAFETFVGAVRSALLSGAPPKSASG